MNAGLYEGLITVESDAPLRGRNDCMAEITGRSTPSMEYRCSRLRGMLSPYVSR